MIRAAKRTKYYGMRLTVDNEVTESWHCLLNIHRVDHHGTNCPIERSAQKDPGSNIEAVAHNRWTPLSSRAVKINLENIFPGLPTAEEKDQ